MYNFGDTIEELDSQPMPSIKEIEQVVPVKFDGMIDYWVVCEPSKATFNIIVGTDMLDQKTYIWVSTKLSNSAMLADLIG